MATFKNYLTHFKSPEEIPTPRETIPAALHAQLSALPATALRGEFLPERVPATGLLIMRDGEPGQPEVTLSPLYYHYQHRAEIETFVRGTDRHAGQNTLTGRVEAARQTANVPDTASFLA